MLVFIIPLQSPTSSKKWEHVSLLCCRCLASVLSQSSGDFRAILVCNEPPIGLQADSRLTVLQYDFPLPGADTKERMGDKWLKVRYGLITARQMAPCHVMVVDADDLVSNRLASIVSADPFSPGWIFECGLLHDEGSKLVFYRKRGFHYLCGTSSIIRLEPNEFPSTEKESDNQCIVLRSGHTGIAEAMAKKGTPLKPLSLPGSVYILNTGENDSKFSLKAWRSKKTMLQKVLYYRFLTSRIRNEFGLFDINTCPGRSLLM